MPDLGLDSIKSNVTNPARVFLWEFEIPSPKGNADSTVWFIRAQSTSLPGKSFEDIDINFKGTGGFRVPGRERYDHNFPVTIIESEDRKGFDAIHSWMNDIRNNISGLGEGDGAVKTDAILKMISQKGETWLQIKMVGMYPKEVGNVELNYNASDAIRFPVVFAYDRWEEVV